MLLGLNVPVPELDHEPPVAIVTLPVKATVALLAQTLISLPAFAVGPGVIVTTIVFVTGLHPPLLVEVKVSVTVPAEISAALGMYTPFIVFGEKLPLPLEVHVPVVVVEKPFKLIFGLFEHTT